ncbi:hypothetical protein WG904_15430 [Pedobacter sp. Du54]|uniref:hypothetical protein n=1 Tax=Pedobacter anseongensis TaxID=3133439 RepID=UPI0030B587AC
MQPFNIHIQNNEEEITLTIIPEKNYYKIVFYGGIIGAIEAFEGGWKLLEEEEIEAGDLPFYDYKHGVDNQPKLELNLPKINQIAAEIENVIN